MREIDLTMLPLAFGSNEETVAKLLKDAADAYVAWKQVGVYGNPRSCKDRDARDNAYLAMDELADCLAECAMTCAAVADLYGIDLQEAVECREAYHLQKERRSGVGDDGTRRGDNEVDCDCGGTDRPLRNGESVEPSEMSRRSTARLSGRNVSRRNG